METAKDYWIELFDEYGRLGEPMLAKLPETPKDAPRWVSRMEFKKVNLLAPKLQLKAGMKMNADRLGVFAGFSLYQFGQSASLLRAPKTTGGPGQEGFTTGANLMGGMEMLSDENLKGLQRMERGARRMVARVLEEKPVAEALPFFKGLARGLQGSGMGMVPRIVDGQPVFTPRQVQTISTVMLYTIIIRDWKVIDSLETSLKAYEHLLKSLPPEILGFDPERIRALFHRFGKTFKAPGRPAGH